MEVERALGDVLAERRRSPLFRQDLELMLGELDLVLPSFAAPFEPRLETRGSGDLLAKGRSVARECGERLGRIAELHSAIFHGEGRAELRMR